MTENGQSLHFPTSEILQFRTGGVSPSAGNGSAGENRGVPWVYSPFLGFSKAMFEYQVALQSTGSFTRME
jgi:hypothetical protein